MLIADYLNEACICTDLQSETKEQILEELADLQFAVHSEIDKEEAMSGLFEREKLLSTGIGDGIAIPHARVSKIDDIRVSLGFLRKDVEFESLDNKPVRLVFLILFPKDNVGLQLRFLARVSRVLQNISLHDELCQCSNPAKVIETFRKYEEKHFH